MMPRQPEKLEQLAEQLKTLSETLATEEASDLSAHRVKRIRQTIAEAYDKLRKVVEDLDPIKHPGFVFEPSNPSRQIILTLATTRAAIHNVANAATMAGKRQDVKGCRTRNRIPIIRTETTQPIVRSISLTVAFSN